MTNDMKVIGGILVATVLLIVAIVVGGGTDTKIDTNPIDVDDPRLVRDYSPRLGPDGAALQIVEFADLQCPACARTQPLLEQAVAEYGSKIQVVFRHFPLSSHQNAQEAAQAAEAAGAQGKFWEMASKLYFNQSNWQDSRQPLPIFQGYAEELGLNTEQFANDYSRQELVDRIRTDTGDGNALGVAATPTIYFNGEEISVPLSYPELKAAIDARLNQTAQPSPTES